MSGYTVQCREPRDALTPPGTLTSIREATRTMAAKKCSKCGTLKPLGDFRVMKNRLFAYCVPCEREYKHRHYIINAERIKAKTRKWARDNKERKTTADRAYRKANRERIIKRQLEYQKKNMRAHLARARSWRYDNIEQARATEQRYRDQNRAICNERIREWKKANPHVKALEASQRRAVKLGATPRWANLAAIEAIYREASRLRQETGQAYHVDHIVPLRSRLVCGLHVEANLQIVPAKENLRKCNYRWPDMP